jgi:hypothetical protein
MVGLGVEIPLVSKGGSPEGCRRLSAAREAGDVDSRFGYVSAMTERLNRSAVGSVMESNGKYGRAITAHTSRSERSCFKCDGIAEISELMNFLETKYELNVDH